MGKVRSVGARECVFIPPDGIQNIRRVTDLRVGHTSSPRGGNDMCLQVQLTQPLPSSILVAGYKALLRQFPILGYQWLPSQNSRDYTWQKMSADWVGQQIQKSVAVMTGSNLLERLSQQGDPFPHLLLPMRVFQTASAELTILANHLFFTARSLLAWLRLLLSCIEAESTGRSVDLRALQLLPEGVQGQRHWRSWLSRISQQPFREWQQHWQHNGVNSKPPPYCRAREATGTHRYRTVHHRFSKPLTTEVMAAAKRAKLSVTQSAVAAVVRTMWENDRARYARVEVPVSIVDSIPGAWELSVGNLVGDAFLAFDRKQDLRRQLLEGWRQFRRNDPYWHLVWQNARLRDQQSKRQELVRQFESQSGPTGHSIVISSFGRLQDFGALVQDFQFSFKNPNHPTLFLYSLQGSLVLQLCYNERYYDPAVLGRYFYRIQEHLLTGGDSYSS